MAFNVREAVLSDCDEVALLIKESDETTKLTGQVLARDAFLSDPPIVHIIVAENILKKIIGYSLYFLTYSMWKGQAMHLESMYVQQPLSTNRHAVENAMLTYLARIAEKENFSKISFESKLPAPEECWTTRYEAEDVTLSENWQLFHFQLNDVEST